MDKNSFEFSADQKIVRSELYERIYGIVRLIPRGKVATYGQIARLAGMTGQARLVGYALHCLPNNSNIPWHRVINRFGKISLSQFVNDNGSLQRNLLESEGIHFNLERSVELQRFQWCE